MSVEEAVHELVANAGRQFDPEVVDVFLRLLREEGKLSLNQTMEFLQELEGSMSSNAF
jgi:HD-GYP domain-containing protein (c-di-GMP phosphodiesterase class II)